MVILALHGFLGRGSDWDFLREAGFEVEAPDLFGVIPSVSEGPGRVGSEDVASRTAQPPRSLATLGMTGGHDVVLGYSMGGRLALHLANKAKLAIIISAAITPGDAARRERDEAWAKRFEHDRWDDLLRDWNAQPLFGGHQVLRREEDFDRRALAAALREWSPAVLIPPNLTTINTRVLWIAGEHDRHYVEEGERAVSLLPDATLAIVEGAGHRVPFEKPQAVVDLLRAALAGR